MIYEERGVGHVARQPVRNALRALRKNRLTRAHLTWLWPQEAQ